MKSTPLSIALFASLSSLFVSGCSTYKSRTHHALIGISVKAYGEDALHQRKRKIEEVLSLSDDIFTDFGLAALADDSVPFNIEPAFDAEDNRTVKYKSQPNGQASTIPLQALIDYDQEYTRMHIMLSEGYAHRPSQRLSALHSELDDALDQVEVKKYISKIW